MSVFPADSSIFVCWRDAFIASPNVARLFDAAAQIVEQRHAIVSVLPSTVIWALLPSVDEGANRPPSFSKD
jgi:hypothetical protein